MQKTRARTKDGFTSRWGLTAEKRARNQAELVPVKTAETFRNILENGSTQENPVAPTYLNVLANFL